MLRIPTLTAVAALALAACEPPEEGPWMDPGVDCLSCHAPVGARAALGPVWSLAGTAFTESGSTEALVGATILVKDAAGQSFEITTNGAGNFYLGDAVTFPLTVGIRYGDKTQMMTEPATSGACNRCHTNDSSIEARGNIFGPQ